MRFGSALVLASLLVTTSAHADPVPSLDLRGFHPPSDPSGNLYLEPTVTPGPLAWNAGAWASYANRVVTLRDGAGHVVASPVEHQFSLDYLFGIGLGPRLALGLELPTIVYQSGSGEQLVGGDLAHTAIGDLGLSAKTTLIPGGPLGGFSLAALSRVTAPTGAKSSYIAEGSATGELRLLAELKLIVAALRVTAGGSVRNPETYLGERFGSELPWGAGLVIKPQILGIDKGGHWEWALESHGALALAPSFASAAQSPALLGVSARYGAHDLALTLGVEAPLDSAVGVPRVRGILGLGWAPREHDMDHDGVPDDQDQCPELAEDRDGFEDSDGCPDFDNDDDGVGDADDKCPHEKEDSDGFQDADGCPDPDNDRDGIPDEKDACPNEAGPASTDPKQNGCPFRDRDGDGIPDRADKCPAAPEDKDGFQDADGCPDPDNDRDRVLDVDDACPMTPGPERSDPKLNGCPSPDQDGDGFDDAVDKCPTEPETFNGVDDDDGCPDADAKGAKKPLASLETQNGHAQLVVNGPLAFEGKGDALDVSPSSLNTLRAIALILNQHPTAVVLVGVRATTTKADAEQRALNQSFAIVAALRYLTHRDQVAESVRFSAVTRAAGAQARGIGIELLE
ncbi:MAG TPA: thrombospondin type 3 repeat-containing protein [Polyangiaceae bacterium]|jgi:hypothetical protein